MRHLVLLASSITSLGLQAQTGPGGVGSGVNNVLWLSGDNGVTVAGAAVTNWNDRSGNNNNATSPSVAASPTLVGASLNGYPTLLFDGTNDELRIPDAGSLDLTQWDIFFVSSENAPKNNNSWFSKGTNTQPNYALWSPSNDALQMPIYDIFGLLSSPSTPAGVTGPAYSVLEYNNTVFFGFFPSRTVYKSGIGQYNDVNLLQLPLANNNQLYIGNVQGTAGWNLDGSLAEFIVFRTPVNSAQRIIINNYLAAKYQLPLTANGIYVQDDPANGNYDHEVAGIGRISNTSLQTDSRGSAVVRINNATGLGNNEFLIWGHDNGILGAWGSTDVPTSVQGRWFRVWRVNEVSPTTAPVDVGSVDIIFDLTNQGPVTSGDLRLLVDLNNNGIFADDLPIAGATFLGGNLYRFAGVNALANNRRFTLATINLTTTPLPIELLYFTAEVEDNSTVRLHWATATENDNDHFTVERSANGIDWEEVMQVPGAGNSSSQISYAVRDAHPLPHLSYYRLQQTDHDGASSYSAMVPVRITPATDGLLVFPDPAQDLVNVVFTVALGSADVHLFNDMGQEFVAPMTIMDGHIRINVSAVPAGAYLVMVITEREVLKKRLVVSR